MIDSITLLRAREAGLPAAESHPDPPLVCYPLKVDWVNAGGYEDPVVPYPAPAVGAHLVEHTDWPRAVRTLAGHAQGLGWSLNVTRAVGTMPHATHGTPTTEKESFAVRLVKGSRRAVAVYRGGSWESLWTWSGTETHHQCKNLGVFKEALRDA